MKLSGRIAIVTGAGGVIGRGIALELARQGANVVAADLDEAAASATADAVGALGRRSLVLRVDVTARLEVEALVSRTVEALGRLDIMVNNAGVGHVRPLVEITEQEWDRVFAVNLKGVLFGTQAAAREMMKQGSGRIVNMASIGGKRGAPLTAAYGASKAAVISLTRSAALELASYQITVNAVCPGVVNTPIWEMISARLATYQGKSAADVVSAREASIPLGRSETPQDVAGVIAFLAGDDASYMTGQALNVCGGVVMN